MERLPYPTDEKGVPVTPTNLNECYEMCLRGAKSTDRHHLAFERRNYKTTLEKRYRNCATMVVEACVCKHRELHDTYLPPEKPSTDVMYQVIRGQHEPVEQEVFIRPRELV